MQKSLTYVHLRNKSINREVGTKRNKEHAYWRSRASEPSSFFGHPIHAIFFKGLAPRVSNMYCALSSVVLVLVWLDVAGH